MIVALARPDEKTAQLFSISGMFVAILQLLPVLALVEDSFTLFEYGMTYVLLLLSLNPVPVAFAYDFYSRFPKYEKPSKPWSTFGVLLYIATAILAITLTGFRLTILRNLSSAAEFTFQHLFVLQTLQRIVEAITIAGLIGICAVIAHNYRNVRENDEKRRIQWVVYGAVLAMIPMAFAILVNGWRNLQLPFSPSEQAARFFSQTASVTTALVPLSIAYAILKHRMFDIHIILRRGAQYLLAKNSLQALIYLPLIFLVYQVRSHPGKTIFQLLSGNVWFLLIAAAGVAAFISRKSILRWLDRKFFREAYNSENILMKLAEEIKNFDSLQEMARWVSIQLESALHPARILVFYSQKDQDNMTLAYSSQEHAAELQIPEDSKFSKIVETTGKSQNFISSEEHKLPQSELQWLQKENIHLVVPISSVNQRLRGLLLLGEKKSEEPYSARDRKLLETLAGQMAMLQENLTLREKVGQGERVQREVLAHLTREKKNLMKECPTCGTCYDSDVERCTRDKAELTLTLPVERLIDKKYRLDHLLGRGGMGAVYQARDLRLRRDVAIKILLGSKFGDAQSVKRFEREARASARLNHPNIVSLYDFGTVGEGAYIVMEFLPGETLRRILFQKGNVSPQIAAEWFQQMFEGMKAAHKAGIVHRDLKPENILISRNEQGNHVVKLLDFGLAKITMADSPESNLTAPGTVVGTIHYMSPEQVAGIGTDERTDIFAIGVIVVETLTGSVPFTGKNATEVAVAIIQKNFELEGTPAELKQLNAAIQKCIAKDPRERYASIAEMQSQLVIAIRNAPPFEPPLKYRPQNAEPTQDQTAAFD
jgi:hypothetical protein